METEKTQNKLLISPKKSLNFKQKEKTYSKIE